MASNNSKENVAPKSSRMVKVLVLSLSGSLTMLASIVFAMVASRYLSKHDYATFRQTFLAYEFLAPLLMLGLPSALYYFLPRFENDQIGVVIDNVTLLFCSALLFCIFIALGGNKLLAIRFNNPDLNKTLTWMVVYPLFVMPIAGMTAVLIYAEKTITIALYSTLSNLLLIIVAIVAVLSTRSYEAPILTRIIVSGIMLPIALILMYKANPGSWRIPNIGSMHRMFQYAVPLGFATMLGTMTMQVHTIIVAALCSTEDFAVYINGAIEIPIIGIVTGSITTVIFADMSTECAKGNKSTALNYFRKASIASASILFPTMCFFFVMAEPFILLMYTEAYRESVWPFMIYLLVLPARIVVYGAAMMALGLTRDILFRSFFDLVINTILCMVFVHFFGYKGAAVGLIITLYLWTIPFNLYKLTKGFECTMQKILPWTPLIRIFCYSIFYAILLAIIRHYLIFENIIFEIITCGIIYAIISSYTLYRMHYITIGTHIEKYIPKSIRNKQIKTTQK